MRDSVDLEYAFASCFLDEKRGGKLPLSSLDHRLRRACEGKARTGRRLNSWDKGIAKLEWGQKIFFFHTNSIYNQSDNVH